MRYCVETRSGDGGWTTYDLGWKAREGFDTRAEAEEFIQRYIAELGALDIEADFNDFRVLEVCVHRGCTEPAVEGKHRCPKHVRSWWLRQFPDCWFGECEREPLDDSFYCEEHRDHPEPTF